MRNIDFDYPWPRVPRCVNCTCYVAWGWFCFDCVRLIVLGAVSTVLASVITDHMHR